jgi:hypothetical protein
VQAFPAYLALVHLLVAVYVIGRLMVRRREAQGDAQFHPMLRTSPTAMEMLPEAGAGQDEAK